MNVRAYARSIYQWFDDTFDYPMFFFNNIFGAAAILLTDENYPATLAQQQAVSE